MTAATPKRPRGRPPKPPEERRTTSIDVRFSELEKADAQRWAELDGCSDPSEWIRRLIAKRGKALDRQT